MSDNQREQQRNVNSSDVNVTDYKLLIDPQIRKGEEKLIRYNGESYNTENHGQGVVIIRDPRPRMNRLWSRREKCDLPVPRYKVDEWYIGAVPPREITFSRLNDNITKQFMEKMCSKFGKLERVRVYYHPKTQKHMGLSKVVFSSMKSAAECVSKLHNTSIMGNVIHAQIDSKGEMLNKLFQRIARGEMVAETIPDVIRHTQDGISMSNKFKERCHRRSDAKKPSQDDPRKTRKSIDGNEKIAAGRHHRHNSSKSYDETQDGNSGQNENDNTDVVESTDNENVNKYTSSDRDDSQSELEPVDLDSRISSLLQEGLKPPNSEEPASLPDRLHERLSLESKEEILTTGPPVAVGPPHDNRDFPPDAERRKLIHSNSMPDQPPPALRMFTGQPHDPPRYDHEGSRDGSRDHSPHYPRGPPERGPEDVNMFNSGRRDYVRGREPPPNDRFYCRPPFDRGYYHRNDVRDGEFGFRRSEGRRPHSPPRAHMHYHHPNHLPRSHYRHPSPPGRFNHPRYSPPRNRTEGRYRGSRSPEHWRRSPGYADGDGPHHFNHRPPRNFPGRSPSPADIPIQDKEPHRGLSRTPSVESNKKSLDQRLKEMTGETSTPIPAGRSKRKKKDQSSDQQPDNESSVDMEISDGESEGEDREKRPPNVNRSNAHEPSSFPNQERWNTDEAHWNNHNVPVPVDGRIWNMPQHDFHKGFERNPQLAGPYQMNYRPDSWPHQFHPHMMPPGILPPFNFAPHDPFHVGLPLANQDPHRMENFDENLCGFVLSAIIEDLKSTVYESWWDENANARPVPRSAPAGQLTDKNVVAVKTEQVLDNHDTLQKPDTKLKSQSLLNAFDPLNWAKNSFEMDGFRIGLGLRSAISKMPSFRVKKRQIVPSVGKDEEADDASKAKKARKSLGKENKEQTGILSKVKKHHRITTLDSEGEDERSEDEESYAESLSDQENKTKPSVLDVDDVFSESSESSDEVSSGRSDTSDEEDSSESEDEEENIEQQETKEVEEPAPVEPVKEAITSPVEKESVPLETDDGKKLEEESTPALASESRTSTDSEITSTVEDSNISSLLSPTALSVTKSAITPQQLRHVHPKKRHRLLSHDQYEPFAKLPAIDKDKLREDLPSHITEKERSVVEALTDMRKTPERRITTDSDASITSIPDKVLPEASQTEAIKNVLRSESPTNELEAVEALLSFKESVPSRPVPKKTGILLKYKDKVSLAESARVAALAEEHNYFTPFTPTRLTPRSSPLVAQILEEHNYSRIIWEENESDFDRPSTPLSVSTLSAESVYNFKDDVPEIISAAERVKLRREQPKKVEKSNKKQRRIASEVKFSPRTRDEEISVATEIWETGLDLEDMKYIRKVYEKNLEDSTAPAWVNDSHWVPHPITATITPKKSKSKRSRRKERSTDESAEPHSTGSARTQGYYELASMVKLRQRREMYGEDGAQSAALPQMKDARNSSNNTPDTGSGNAGDKNLGTRETRHFMRRIAAEVGSDAGDLFKYNQLMFRKKAVKFKRSSIHGWGLFAEEPIAADEMVIEYVGQVVRTQVAERREVNYTKLGIGSSYLFRIDTEHIIDATKCGNYARFMNHSCNPSCYAKVITVDTAKKIVIYSKGPIKKSQEITYDYKFPLEDDKIMCFCGAENCRRTLN